MKKNAKVDSSYYSAICKDINWRNMSYKMWAMITAGPSKIER